MLLSQGVEDCLGWVEPVGVAWLLVVVHAFC